MFQTERIIIREQLSNNNAYTFREKVSKLHIQYHVQGAIINSVYAVLFSGRN
jgi:hypothetical protein